MSCFDEQDALKKALAEGFPANMRAALEGTWSTAPSKAGECPSCGGVEWDHITSERGMHPSELPVNRCPCGHSWQDDEPEERICAWCNGTGIEGIDRGEGMMPRCGACKGRGATT